VSQTPAATPEGVILRIEFSGLRRISPAALRAHITSRAGQPLERARVENDVRALNRLGWFESVSAEVSAITDMVDGVQLAGLRLVFVLPERLFLAQVEFRGSAVLSHDRIRAILAEKQITLKLAAPVNPFELWRAARVIGGALADLGHPQAQVRMHLEEAPVAAVRARFEIRDGPHITVGRVTFAGNRAFSEEKLRRQMKRVAPNARFAALRSKTVFTPERLAKDLERLENFYRNHGYPEARLAFARGEVREERVQRWFPWPHRETAQRFHISIPVEEGTFYRFGTVTIDNELGTAKASEPFEALPRITRLTPGEPYSQEKLERARDTLARLRPSTPSKDHSLPPEVELAPQFDPARGIVRVTFRIHKAHPYIVRRLEFLGERRFSDRYFRRRILLKEGEPFDPDKLELGLTQLARAGFIRPVKREDIRMRFDEAQHSADVAIRVQEIGQQRFSLVGGRTGLGNTLGIVYNVFDLLGGEELITAHIEGGPQSLQLLLGIAKEGVFGTRASLALSLLQNRVQPILAGASGRKRLFTSGSSGVGLGGSYPVTPSDTLTMNYTLSRGSTQYDVALPAQISGLVSTPRRASISSRSVRLDWTHEADRNRVATAASVSGGWLGGKENLVRPSFEYVRLQPDPLSQTRNTWAFRGYAAGVSSLRGDLPLYARYFTGDQLVRGFRTGELAPYALVKSTNASGTDSFRAQGAGANLVGAVNAEYRVPLAPRTQAAGFFDAGSGWLLPNWLGPDRPTLLSGTNGALRASTGIELRWLVPVVNQTVRLHFAVNPLHLARPLLLPDGGRFHPPDQRTAWGWALGSLF